MNKKSDKKKLLDIITKPQKNHERIWLSAVTLILSLIGLFVAWWFWHAIVQNTERPRFDVIGYAAPIGLAIASLSGIFGTLQITKRRATAANTVWTATTVGGVCFIGITINSVIAFIRYDEINWLQSVWQAFVDFNLIEIGPVSLTITTVITIAIIVSAIVTDTLKNTK